MNIPDSEWVGGADFDTLNVYAYKLKKHILWRWVLVL